METEADRRSRGVGFGLIALAQGAMFLVMLTKAIIAGLALDPRDLWAGAAGIGVMGIVMLPFVFGRAGIGILVHSLALGYMAKIIVGDWIGAPSSERFFAWLLT